MQRHKSKWDYMIAHYKKFNEWAILRVNENDTQWLNYNDEWTRDKSLARRFYHQETAEGALVLCKMRGFKEESRKQEKQSWSEL